ncbi:M1 family metallopeptidase [Mucilaginibacter daejeonensis]|uniref:M1 family metallopeptidase n=1 Tax=Mucilaginibacter daejeonensis TaxID=398049 RepID=UPI001D17CA62|nr:M1 family metallopeptidase [Mucilaginibacter daejeonensis]UEG54228.1 M1 family metallopeptidase [Mucilaginibacter daejeonensis]
MNHSSRAALLSACMLSAATFSASAQTAPAAPENPALKIYRSTPEKINDLIHTKLDVRFDYKKRYLYGKEWVTIKPHMYPTDTLRLDAKGMDIKTVAIVKAGKNTPLKFTYDSLTLAIKLDRVYRNNENYTIYLDYTSKPDELKVEGSMAISDAKGLYFINPDSAVKGKPVQIWTQGESQSSSAWFPTIDRPNQKTTEEIYMTVPAKYVTLSNGKLVSQKKNANGTRTDYWKMDLPHSPYLFMMAVGDFKITKDTWKGKEVSYYLEPKYAPYAKTIFGYTPEVMDFYSKLLGVDYPWNKYSQIVVRDYVSGAMENTTATLHGDYVQGTARQFLDRYYNIGAGESTVVHELFHQWFGDYVTAESWSNLTVNESFADFSETLWAEHKYGKDDGDAHIHDDRRQYLNSPDAPAKDLVRFHYNDKEDMFDVVTYQKGGSILYMLRNYLGNDAFYKGLNIYLKTNAFKNGEAHQLRLALEEASGKDLNWFFNQWYFNSGHPILNVTYNWDAASKSQSVYVQQNQAGNAFNLPVAIDIYTNGKKTRHNVWLHTKADTLTFKTDAKPDLVNFDGDKMLLARKTDNKTGQEFLYQQQHAGLYLDRYEALNWAEAQRSDDATGRKIIIAALNDKYYGLRIKAIKALKLNNDDVRNAAQPILVSLAQKDPNNMVKAAALNALAGLKASGNTTLFKQALADRSYAVQGAALNGLTALDPAAGLTMAKSLEKDSEGELAQNILSIYAANGSDAEWPYVNKKYDELPVQSKFNVLRSYAGMIGRLQSSTYAQQGVETLSDLGVRYKQYGVAQPIITMLEGIKAQRTKIADDASVKAIDAAIKKLQ